MAKKKKKSNNLPKYANGTPEVGNLFNALSGLQQLGTNTVPQFDYSSLNNNPTLGNQNPNANSLSSTLTGGASMSGGGSSLANAKGGAAMGNKSGGNTGQGGQGGGPLGGVMKLLNGPLAPLAGMAMNSVTDMIKAINTPERERRPVLQNAASYTFENGGTIKIKPSKKGTFTAAAKKRGKSVQAFASQVLANKDNYSPAMVKKANFARNAAKWKKAMGGLVEPEIFANGGLTGTYMDAFDAMAFGGMIDPSMYMQQMMYGSYAQGGQVPQNIPVEVEGEEMYEMPNGEVGEFSGPKHENGGMPMALPEGTKIYSDRLKVNGKTMAARKDKREANINKLERLLTKNPNDKFIKEALKRQQETNALEESQDMQQQEIVNEQQAQQEMAMEEMLMGAAQQDMQEGMMMAMGGMIKRADGSYSKRGLWDNIRANRGSGKKPTKQMLAQEKKIRAAEKAYGGMIKYADGGTVDTDPFKKFKQFAKPKIKPLQNYSVLFPPELDPILEKAVEAQKIKRGDYQGIDYKPIAEPKYTHRQINGDIVAVNPDVFSENTFTGLNDINYTNYIPQQKPLDVKDLLAQNANLITNSNVSTVNNNTNPDGTPITQNVITSNNTPLIKEQNLLLSNINNQPTTQIQPVTQLSTQPNNVVTSNQLNNQSSNILNNTFTNNYNIKEAESLIDPNMSLDENEAYYKNKYEQAKGTSNEINFRNKYELVKEYKNNLSNVTNNQPVTQSGNVTNNPNVNSEFSFTPYESSIIPSGSLINAANAGLKRTKSFTPLSERFTLPLPIEEQLVEQEKQLNTLQPGTPEYEDLLKMYEDNLSKLSPQQKSARFSKSPNPNIIDFNPSNFSTTGQTSNTPNPLKSSYEPGEEPLGFTLDESTSQGKNLDDTISGPLSLDINPLTQLPIPDDINADLARLGFFGQKGFANYPEGYSPTSKTNNAMDVPQKENKLAQFFNKLFGKGKEKQPKGKKDKTIPGGYDFTQGDKTGMFGTSVGMFGPALMTMLNRMETPPNVNFFSTFGQDALATQQEAEGLAGISKDEAYRKNLMRANALRKQLTNTARGVNDIRSGQLSAALTEQEGARGILANYLQGMAGLKGQRAALQQQIDQTRMGGEQQRDLADRQDLDQFYTNLAENVANASNMIQKQGRDLNVAQYNKDIMSLAKSYSKYGVYPVRDPRTGLLTLAHKGANGKITYLSDDKDELKQQLEELNKG